MKNFLGSETGGIISSGRNPISVSEIVFTGEQDRAAGAGRMESAGYFVWRDGTRPMVGQRLGALLWCLSIFSTAGGPGLAASQADLQPPPAQFSQEGSKLTGMGAVGPGEQGWSVALSADGNTAIVGGIADNKIRGAAWVFTRSDGLWAQQGSKLAGTGAVGSAAQGFSVALSGDGNTAIVGGPFDSSYAGAAWVFTRSNGVWSQQGDKLVGTGAVERGTRPFRRAALRR
jgi:hypothetical protein